MKIIVAICINVIGTLSLLNAQEVFELKIPEISKEEQAAYFRDVITPNLNKPDPEMILFSIFKNQEWIGYGGLVHIDWKKNKAEVSFLVCAKRASDIKIYEEDFIKSSFT